MNQAMFVLCLVYYKGTSETLASPILCVFVYVYVLELTCFSFTIVLNS